MSRIRVVAFAVVAASWSPSHAQGVLFSENFEGLTLLDSVEEGVAVPFGDPFGIPGASVWTNIPPAGWMDDDSGVPGIGNPADNNGVFDWAGWNFADRDWWVVTANDQNRSQFVNASGTIMVADPDEWNDAPHPGGPPNGPWYDTFISTPPISLAGVQPNSVVLDFDSSWRPEFDFNYQQAANIVVSYDGGVPIEVLRWESDGGSPFFHSDAPNEHVTLGLNNPAGANEMVLTFGVFDAGNDWWWALDNIVIITEEETIYIAHFVGGITETETLGTTIAITNAAGSGKNASDPDATRASATVESFDAMGQPSELLALASGDGLVSLQSVSLIGRATRLATTGPHEVSPDEPEPVVNVGWVRIRSEADLHVEATFSIRDKVSGKLKTRASVPGQTPKKGWNFPAHNVLNPASGEETVRTGMAILNPLKGNQEAKIQIHPLNFTGLFIGEPIEIVLKPGERIAKFLDELAPGIRDFWGEVILTSDVPVVVLPLLQEGSVLTTQKVSGK